MIKNVWVVGRNIDYSNTVEGQASRWDFQGVFDTEEQAIKACRDYTYFIGPVEMNTQLPEELISWPEGYYPINRN